MTKIAGLDLCVPYPRDAHFIQSCQEDLTCRKGSCQVTCEDVTIAYYPPCCYASLMCNSLCGRAVKHSEMSNMEDESCAICLVEYAQEDELRKLPCGHAFHKGVRATSQAPDVVNL